MLVSLLAELAIDYATLRASQERLSIADRNVVAARTSVELTEQRFARGLGNNLDVAQAQAQLQMVLSAQPPLRADIARMTHAISVLLGQIPGGALEQKLAGQQGKYRRRRTCRSPCPLRSSRTAQTFARPNGNLLRQRRGSASRLPTCIRISVFRCR